VFVWNIVRARRRIRVSLIPGVSEDGESGVFIFVLNPSALPVHVSSIQLMYPYEAVSLMRRLREVVRYRTPPSHVGWTHTSLRFRNIDDGCPATVEPGMSHKVFVPDDVVEDLLKDGHQRLLRAAVQDQLWTDTYSAPMAV
jgi:hypothetical protein